MAYTLWKFGSIELPPYNRSTKMTPVRPRTALVATASGVSDAWGSGRAQAKFPHTISLQCTLVAETVATWRSSIDALRAAVGTRATLVRRAEDDGAVQKCEARLVDCQYSQVGRLARHQQLTLTFEQLNHWRGKRWEDWELDDGYLLDDGLYLDTGAIDLAGSTVDIVVGGNLPALNVATTITIGGSVAPSFLQFSALGGYICVLTIDDEYEVGDVYVIDSAARLATKNGGDAYALISLDTPLGGEGTIPEILHSANEWLIVEPGSLSLGLWQEGEPGFAVTALLTFTEAWA